MQHAIEQLCRGPRACCCVAFLPDHLPACLSALPVPCHADTPGVMDEPEQWQVLADGYCAAGCTDAAVALVTDKLGGLGKGHERWDVHVVRWWW